MANLASEAIDWIKGHPLPAALFTVGVFGVAWYVRSHGSSTSGATITGVTGPYTVVPMTGATTGGTNTNGGPAPSTGATTSGNGGNTSTTTTSTPNNPPAPTTSPTTSSALTTAANIANFNAGVSPIEAVSAAPNQAVTYDPQTNTYNGVVTAPSGQEYAGLGALTGAQSNALAQNNAAIYGSGVSETGQVYGTNELSAASIARIQQIYAMPGG